MAQAVVEVEAARLRPLRSAPLRLGSPLEDAIEAAPDADAVAAVGHELPRAVCALADAGLDPEDIGRAVATTIDAMTSRLLDLAVERLGPPPVPWAWLSLGSAARREQAISTDQDHALAFDPGDSAVEDLDPYFLELAEFATSGLEAAGIPRCRADVVAENRALRRPLEHWTLAFRQWMEDPRPEATRQTAILFDFRRVAGDLEAESTFSAVIRSNASPAFIRRLVGRTREARPPTRRFRDFVVEATGEHTGRLDLKHGGLMPIVDLARIYALDAGVTDAGTLDRLRLAAEAGRIDDQTRLGLAEAFRLMWRIRLDHHVARVRQGAAADDFIDPRSLELGSRIGMGEAFRLILRAQRSLAREYGIRAA